MYWKKLLNWPKIPEKNKNIFIEGKKINLRNKKIEDAVQRFETELRAKTATHVAPAREASAKAL